MAAAQLGARGLRQGAGEWDTLQIDGRNIAEDLLLLHDLGKNGRSGRNILLSHCREFREGEQHLPHSLYYPFLVQRGVMNQI